MDKHFSKLEECLEECDEAGIVATVGELAKAAAAEGGGKKTAAKKPTGKASARSAEKADSCLATLNRFRQENPVPDEQQRLKAQAAAPSKIDPAIIDLAVQLGIQLLNWWRGRKGV